MRRFPRRPIEASIRWLRPVRARHVAGGIQNPLAQSQCFAIRIYTYVSPEMIRPTVRLFVPYRLASAA